MKKFRFPAIIALGFISVIFSGFMFPVQFQKFTEIINSFFYLFDLACLILLAYYMIKLFVSFFKEVVFAKKES